MTTPRDVLDFARADLRSLPLYAPDDSACAIDLSDNTNLWGSPPAAMRALAEESRGSVSRYPSLYCEPLREALLDYSGASSMSGVSVVTGCGSDDVLDSTMRAFGAPGDTIAFCAPTFSMIPVQARLNGLTPLPLPFRSDFDIDADRLVESAAKITYICSPNNPTATPVSRAAVEYVASHARGIVLIDEAYAEFSPEVFVDLLSRHEHVVVARTFSKAFGLAGLRVGYAIGAEPLVRFIERARGPYKVNALAERAAFASLQPAADARGWVEARAALAISNRERLSNALREIGLRPLPSAANFVMVPTARAREFQRALAARGILVRAFSGMRRDVAALEESAGAALRIGVGPWEMMEPLIAALKELIA